MSVKNARVDANTGRRLVPRLSDEHVHTVSGISAGGFMAVQHHIAFSKVVEGVGVLAGGPFWCAQGKLPIALTACMKDPELISVAELVSITETTALSGFIDPPAYLKEDAVWLFSGTADTVVDSGVVFSLRNYYKALDVDNVVFVNEIPAEHSMVTNNYGNACGFKGEPYINSCNYDAAGKLLLHAYNSSNNPSHPPMKEPVAPRSANIIEFDQTQFFADVFVSESIGLSNVGYMYVPSECSFHTSRLRAAKQAQKAGNITRRENAQKSCRLHIAYHGCLQTLDKINKSFVEYAGYNGWAESNNIVVIYPQAKASVLNPKGCFDWWGYTGPEYASKIGAQLSVVRRIVERYFDANVSEHG